MPAAVMSWAAPAVLGGLGLLQQREQSRKQNNLMNRAQSASDQALQWQNLFNETSFPAFQQLAGLATKYDPMAEAQATVKAGQPVFQQALSKALGDYNAKSEYGGMSSGLSTEGQIRQAQAVRGPTNAFESLVADAFANPTAKRMQALQSVIGQSAGNLTQGYFQGANQLASMAGAYQPNYGASASLLSQALQQAFKKNDSGGDGRLSFFG